MVEKKIIESYGKYGRVLSISNGTIEAYVTIDMGPRIIRFGRVNGQNFMRNSDDLMFKKTDDEFTKLFGDGKYWQNLGGHRIWASPEKWPETYYPDCDPVQYTETEDGAIFTPNEEKELGLQKQLLVEIVNGKLKVENRIKNTLKTPQTYSVWALSVSNVGGTLIIPMNRNNTGLLSNRTIMVWPYTDLSDDRIFFGQKYITLRQDVDATTPIKLGLDLNQGTVYYVLNEQVFKKVYSQYHPTAAYPDNNVSFETYTNNDFIEIETLSPIKEVAPGEWLTSSEEWSVYDKPCKVDFKDNDSIDGFVKGIE